MFSGSFSPFFSNLGTTPSQQHPLKRGQAECCEQLSDGEWAGEFYWFLQVMSHPLWVGMRPLPKMLRVGLLTCQSKGSSLEDDSSHSATKHWHCFFVQYCIAWMPRIVFSFEKDTALNPAVAFISKLFMDFWNFFVWFRQFLADMSGCTETEKWFVPLHLKCLEQVMLVHWTPREVRLHLSSVDAEGSSRAMELFKLLLGEIHWIPKNEIVSLLRILPWIQILS